MATSSSSSGSGGNRFAAVAGYRRPVILAVLLVVGLTALLTGAAGSAAAATTTAPDCTTIGYTGSGTADNPYEVKNVSQLQCMGNSSTSTSLSDSFALVSDIDASGTDQWNSGKGFDPVGGEFNGSFDGNGRTIDGLTIDRGTASTNGLFEVLNESATVRNVTLTAIDISGDSRNGGIAGLVRSGGATVRNVTVKGSVSGSNTNGGLIGEVYSNSGTLIADSSTNITISGTSELGGAVGSVASGTTISNVTTEGTIDASGNRAGGLVGDNYGTIENASSSVTITSTGSRTGGLVGFHAGTGILRDSYATGNVTSGLYTGGVVGIGEGTVNRVYATGYVNGTDNVGGLIGYKYGGSLNDSYAVGLVNGSSNVGGLVGFKSEGSITDSYWNVNTTNQSSSSGGGKGLTTTEMTGSAAESNMDFDFTNTWTTTALSGNSLDSYPFLQSNTQEPAPSPPLYAGGDGTASNPYEIANWYHLNNTRQNLSSEFELVSNLTSTTAGYDEIASPTANGGKGFKPIGGTIESGRPFSGGFDGDGHTIEDLYINRTSESYVGLFRKVDSGYVEQLGLENATVSGAARVGGIAGTYSGGRINDSYVTGNVTGVGERGNTGALVGVLVSSGTVTNSSATANVTGTQNVGGLVGKNLGSTIKKSYATGPVSGSSNNVGGLVGYNDFATIEDSYATGTVAGSSNVGGLAGKNSDTIKDSYATGKVSGSSSVGGLVGLNATATVTDGYWNVNTTNQSSSASGTGLTTAEMLGEAAKSNMDFNFRYSSVWTVKTSGTVSYPYLQANTQSPAPGQRSLYAGGSGTASDPYEIATWTHLDNVRQNPDANFTLVNDLNTTTDGYSTLAAPSADSGTGFDPIGTSGTSFTGSFDGNGYTIANLTIDRTDSPRDVGLFGYIGSGGSVSNVTLTEVDVEVTANDKYPDVGTLAGSNSGTISNVTVSGNVTYDSSYVGGIVGASDGTITRSTASVTVNGGSRAGGLVGSNDGTVTRSSASGNVSGSSYIGGLVGTNDGGSIEESYATGTVTGTGIRTGGLVGSNSGTVAGSYATATVSGDGDVGGLVGNNGGGTVKNSYAVGNVSGSDDLTTGGLVGSGTGTVTESYWNTKTTNQSESNGGTGLTTLQMVGEGAMSQLAFDFSNTWTVVNRVDNGNEVSYPVLRNNTQTPAPGLQTLFAGGAGTDADPFEIANWTHLDQVRADLDANFTLVADLSETTAGYSTVAAPSANGGKGFDPLGSSTVRFNGSFDGTGHTITNLTIDLTIGEGDSTDLGLFGQVGGDGRVANVSLVSANVSLTGGSFDDATGMLAGYSKGTLVNVAVDGTVTGSYNIGGVVGSNYGSIRNATATGTITGTSDVGGIVGDNRGVIKSGSFSAATVTASSGNAGGLVGYNSGTVQNGSTSSSVTSTSYVGGAVGYSTSSGTVANISASGTVKATSTDYNGAGGLVGYNDGVVRDSSASGDVDGAGFTVGGLVGQNAGTISDSSASGDVTGVKASIGGLVGYNTGSVTNGSASGNVTITDGGYNAGGGLVGQNDGGTIRNSSASGDVDGAGNRLGGLVGDNRGTIVGSYALGMVNGSTDVGGLVGNNTASGSINASYATGAVDGSTAVASLVGYNNGTVRRTYAVGAVTGDSQVGGLVGSSDGTVTDSYWDENTTGQSSSDGGTGLTTDQMRGQPARSNMAGFDFTNTWAVKTGGTVSYPYLQANTQTPAPGQRDRELYAGGTGTESAPYQIADWRDLANVSYNLDANYTLVSDLSETTAGYETVAAMSANGGNGFEPLGQSPDSGTAFSGTFDGNGHTISDLEINSTSGHPAGMFEFLLNATVTDLTVSDATVIANGSSPKAGALAGVAAGTDINGVTATGVVTVNPSTTSAAGGLVGTFAVNTRSDGIITRPTANLTDSQARVTVTGDSNVGGLVGRFATIGGNTTIANASATGDVTASGQLAGRLIGWTISSGDTVITNSSATGNVSESSRQVGGFVGTISTTTDGDAVITDSYATGTVTASGKQIGGFVGLNDGGVLNRTYATGNVTGHDTVGGLVGEISPSGIVTNSYAVGNTTATAVEPMVGGLVGENAGTLTDSYFTNATTGQFYAVGAEVGTTNNVSGLPTTSFVGSAVQQQATGFNFTTGWDVIDTSISRSYPYLQRNPQTPVPRPASVTFVASPDRIRQTPITNNKSVQFNGTTVAGVTFSQNVTGRVEVSEFNETPDSVVEEIDETAAPNANAAVVSVVDISAVNVTDNATVTITQTVPLTRVSDVNDLVVFHETASGYEQLPTKITAIKDGSVVVSAQTDSFSIFAVGTIPTDDSDPSPDDDDGGGGGGGLLSTDRTGPLSDIVAQLDRIEPAAETTLRIADATPDTAGVTVRTESGSVPVESITIPRDAGARISIESYPTPPESVTTSIVERVRSARSSANLSANVVSVLDITRTTASGAPPEQSVSATIRLQVARSSLGTPENAVVFHETASGWERLETTVVETSGETVTLETRTDSFSLFTIASVQTPTASTTDAQADTDDTTTVPEPPTDGSGGSVLLVAVVLAVIAAGGAVVWLRWET